MEATLKFNLPEDADDFETACKANRYFIALEEVGYEIFRPARKHGYGSNARLKELTDGPEGESVCEAIGLLEAMYFEILRSNGVEI